jgi:two-component system sensor histidine kinase KdpD
MQRITRAESLSAVVAAGAVLAITQGYLAIGVTNSTIVALTFLTVALAVATLSTLRLAILTSVATTACLNYYFLPPVRTWTIADPQNWAALFVSLVVSLVASNLSLTARRRAAEAQSRRDEVIRLFDLTRDILLATEGPDALDQISRFIARRFRFDGALICVPGRDGWRQHGAPDFARESDDRLERVWAASKAPLEFDAYTRTYSGHDVVQTAHGAERALVPLRLGTDAIGVLVTEGPPCDPGTREAIAGVAAIAIERLALLDDRRQAEIVRRSSELRSALFASLSHDLKTPLTAIAVAAANINAPELPPDQRAGQIEIVQQQVQRLNRLFQNIVDMARIETASVTPEREPVVAADVVLAAEQLVGPALLGHEVRFTDSTHDATARVDPRLTSAALAHLLENAAQYSNAGSTIDVTATTEDAELRIEVRDHGRGISPADRTRLFDRFHRGVEGIKHPLGSGLGLAITHGLLLAQGGRVWADNHPEGGAVFTIAIPIGATPADEGPVSPPSHT